MSRRDNQATRNAPPTTNANEEGSGTGTGGVATLNVQDMFNQYMRDVMGFVLGPVRGIGKGGVVQPPRADFAKIS